MQYAELVSLGSILWNDKFKKKQSWSLRRFPSIQSQGNIVKSPHDQDHTTGKKQLQLAILPWAMWNPLGARLATLRNTVKFV